MTAFTIFVFGGMSTEVAFRCGVTRASQPQPAPDGVEMQPEMQTEMPSREKLSSPAAGAAAAAEGWLRPGGWAEGWGFGPVGAPGRTDLLSRDEGEDEGEGADEGRPQVRNKSGRLPLGLLTGAEHATDHARQPRGAARRPCSLPRSLAAAIALVAVFALGTSFGRPAMCAAPQPALPNERTNERRVDTRTRTRRHRSLVSHVRADPEGPPPTRPHGRAMRTTRRGCSERTARRRRTRTPRHTSTSTIMRRRATAKIRLSINLMRDTVR